MLTTTSDVREQFSSVDEMEQELLRLEGLISKIRARQADILRVVDGLQVPHADGTRSLKEWVTGRLDIHPRTAGDLAVMAKAEPGPVADQATAGIWSFDRVAGTQRLANTGADPDVMEQADGVPVSQLSRFSAKHTRMTDIDHHEAFQARRMWFQPNLTNTFAHGTITMTGPDVDVFLDALDTRADELVSPSDEHRPSLEQRRVDALVSLALDTVVPDGDGPAPRRVKAHVLIDATDAAATGGETGAMTLAGVKIGPSTLEEILCVGETTTTLIDRTGVYAVRTDGDRLPQRIREYVFHRDLGACTADGCTSTYRLEPHHITPQADRKDHHPDNLTLLCWFHHHVVVHQMGYNVNPNTPTHRRRFTPSNTRPDPPT